MNTDSKNDGEPIGKLEQLSKTHAEFDREKVIATAVAALDVQPRSIDFGLVEHETATNAEVVIVCKPNAVLHITNAVWDAAGFTASYRTSCRLRT